MSDGRKLKPCTSSSTFQAMQRRDPIDWIESQVREHGLLRVLWAPVLVVAAVSSLSAWFAGNPLAGLFVAVSLVAIWAVVLLVVSLTQTQRIRNDFDQLRWSLSTLRQYVVDQLPSTPRSVLWRDEIDVERNGDMHARTEFRILVEGDRALHFLEFGQVGEPLSRAEQRQVVFTVRQDPGGVRVPVDVEWESDTSARFWALLRWLEHGRGEPIRPGRYHITRASSANASARRAVGRTSVPRSKKPRRRFWTKACPATITLAVRSRFSPRIGRRRALRRPWSVSSGLFAWTCVSWKAAGSSSSRTRG
jgi:hypothetical protein